jgi:hypothetical protein
MSGHAPSSAASHCAYLGCLVSEATFSRAFNLATELAPGAWREARSPARS